MLYKQIAFDPYLLVSQYSNIVNAERYGSIRLRHLAEYLKS